MKIFDSVRRRFGNEEDEGFDLKLSLKKAFTTNIVAKLLCLFAAVCLWFYVMGTESTNFERTFKGVEVSFSKNVNGLQILSSDRVTVDVILSGKRSVLNRMDASDINATVDISNITKTGTDTFAIKVNTSNDTSVESFSPRSVELHLDEPYSKTVSVEVDYRGGTSDSEHLSVGKITPSKKNVQITGPKDAVSKVALAKAVVELNFISHSVYIENADLYLYDENGNKLDGQFIEIASGDDTVDVDVDVYMRKELPIVPVMLQGIYDSEHLSVKPEPEKILVKGEIYAVEKLTEISTEPIDEKKLSGKVKKIKAGLVVPTGVTLAGAEAQCDIEIYAEDYVEREVYLPIDSVIIRNLPESSDSLIHESGITVTVCGVNSVVSKVRAEDITLEIHGETLSGGLNTDVPVSVEFVNSETANMYIKDLDYSVDININ